MHKPQFGVRSRAVKGKPVPKNLVKKSDVRYGANVGSPYKKKPVAEVPAPLPVVQEVVELPVAQEVTELPAFEIDAKVEEPVVEETIENWKTKRDKKKQVIDTPASE